MSTRAEPEGAKAQRVDTDYVFGCRECWRLEGSLHAPTCRLAYGTGTRPAGEGGRRVGIDECRKFQAAVDPNPRRSKR